MCNRSFGHNVPIINGSEQAVGPEFQSEYFRSDGKGKVELSFAGAYEMDANWKLKRVVESYEEDETLLITDTICSVNDISLEERLITQIEPVVLEDKIVLKGQKGSLDIQITEAYKSVRVEKEIFHNHRGKDEDVWLITFPVTVNAGNGECQINCKYNK